MLSFGYARITAFAAVCAAFFPSIGYAQGDTTPPRIASIERLSPTSPFTNGAEVTWRVTFNEPVNNIDEFDFFENGDNDGDKYGSLTVVGGGGAASSVDLRLASNPASSRQLRDYEGTISLFVSGGHNIQDLSGNALTNFTPLGANESFTFDHVAPTLAITGPAGPVSAPFTATFTFSEGVNGFTIGDIAVGNGAASNFQSVSASVYTATITPALGGTVTVDVAGGEATDFAGNANTAASQYSVGHDAIVPTVAITGPAGPVNAAFTATFTFSENVTGFAVGDITVGNGAASNFQSSSATVYTATITPVVDGPVTVNVAANAVQDSGGNGNTAASQFSVTYDSVAPTLAVTGPAGPVNAAFVASFTFSENVTGFAVGDIIVGNGAASNLQSSSASVYTATITPASDGIVSVNVGSAAAQDAAGNDNTASSQYSVTHDATAPSLSITGPAGPVNGAFLATFSFSEAVSGFAVGDIIVSNGAASNFQSVTTSVYTATITPVANGSVTVNVPANTAQDAAGNGNTAAGQYSVTNSQTVPSLTITGPAGPVNAAFVATFTFSETVTGFALGDIVVGNGAASNFQSASATVYSATITPAADGAVTVDVAANAAQGTGGTGNTAATRYSVAHDGTRPTLAITGPAGPVSGAFTARLTASEAVTGLDISHIIVSNGTATNLRAEFAFPNDVAGTSSIPAATNFVVTITPSADGLVTIDIAGLAAQDAAGNGNTAAIQFSVTNDQTRPTAALTGPAGPVAGAFSVTVTFNEAVTGLELADLIVANGTASNLQSSSTSVYTATITPASAGTVTLNLASGAAVDAAGNGNSAASQYSVTHDTVAPTLAITGQAGPVNAAFTATFTFSEDVTGFAVGDIAVGNGAASNFQSASASVYLATITPAADGAVTVNVAANAAQDSGGTGNTAATQYSVTLDATAPTLSITGPAGPVSGVFSATFSFSENVTGFGLADVTVGNGAASNVQSISASVYTATITPAADGSVTIDIAGLAAQDAAGNGNTAATQFTVTNDQTAPTATLTGPAGPVAGAFSVTVTFNEAVTGLELADLIVANGTASNLQSSSTSVYTATITPASAGTVTLNLASAAAVDAAGNGNAAASPYSVVNDVQASTIVISGPAGPVSGAFTATFTFSEDVTGFALGDIIVGNGAASNFQSASASVYTATISPSVDGEVSVDVPGGAATDSAGNGNPAAARFSLTNDQTGPTLTIAGPAGPVTGAFTASLTFSEPVTGLVLSEIGVSNGTASNLRAEFAADGSVAGTAAIPPARNFSVTVTPTSDGLVTVSVAGGVAADTAGNANTAAAPFSVTNNRIPPSVVSITRSNPTAALTNADTLVWAVRFSEAVTDIDPGDFDVSGTTGTITTVSPQTAGSAPTDRSAPVALSASAFLVTAGRGDLASVNGDVILSFSPDQNIVDLAGERLTSTTPSGANDNSYRLDNVVPTVAVTTSASIPVAGPFTVSVTFSEDVTGFDSSDISVGGGTVSNFQVISAAAYTALITPGSVSAVAIVIPAASGHDAAGNGNTASAPLALSHDPDRLLTVILPGVGTGTVTSSPAGINCGTDCTQDYGVGSSITLTAAADAGSSFASWTTGPCTGSTETICAFAINTDTIASARFTLDSPPAGRIVAATLPGARSGHLGGPDITALLTVVSRTSSPAQSCQIAAPAGAPVGLTYRQLDATGIPTGADNPLFDIDAGGSLNFVLALSPDRRTSPGGYEFMPVIACENASLDPIVGISSVLLTIGEAPTPDILSIAATPSGDGVIRIPFAGGVQFMTASAVNIGIGDGSGAPDEVTLTATVDTGATVLPVTIQICQINEASICITPRGSSVTTTMSGTTPLFFAVYVRDTSTGGIPFDPANARVFLRFADASGTIRSATSAAVTAPAAADIPVASAVPSGRWSVLMRRDDGGWPGLVRTSLHVASNGVAIVDDGVQPRLEVLDPAIDTGMPGRFRQDGTIGISTGDGLIRLGGAWVDLPGEFWGVRDARSGSGVQWRDVAGAYGGSVHILESGEIRGVAGGCAVYGQASGTASSVTLLSLTGCAMSGSYAAVIDLPANDNEGPVLVIAGPSAGWRLAQ